MKTNKNSIAKNEKFSPFFIPIIMTLIFVPLLLRLVEVQVDVHTTNLYGFTETSDFFSQGKAFLLLVFAIIMVLTAIFLFKKIIKPHKGLPLVYLISIGIFLLFCILSAIFSPYNQVSIYGFHDRAEGIITLASYVILFLYTFYTYNNTNDFRCVVLSLCLVIGITSFLGVFQYIGRDLMTTEIGRLLTIPAKYRESYGEAELLYQTGKLYGTFFHYNYVGSFVALTIPILTVLVLFIKPLKNKIVLGIFLLLSFWLLFGSTSRAGIIGVSASVFLGIILFSKIIFKKWKLIIAGTTAFLVMVVGLNVLTSGKIFERLPGLVADVFSVFEDTSDFNYKDHIPVKDIISDGNDIAITTQTGVITISATETDLSFTDENNQVINYLLKDQRYETTDERFSAFGFQYMYFNDESKRPNIISLAINGQVTFLFKVSDDDKISASNFSGSTEINVSDAETFGFNGKEKLGSMRGYIWSRTLPLCKDSLLLGSGPDTFIFEFPQYDYLGKYYAYGTPNMIVDKPHNLYLQMFVNDGGIALLAFMILVIAYIIESLRLYAFKKEYSPNHIVGVATCLAIIGYLFAGIFNDSTVGVAPIFWILLGVGVAVNTKIKASGKVQKVNPVNSSAVLINALEITPIIQEPKIEPLNTPLKENISENKIPANNKKDKSKKGKS